jgi:hypothetical protein
LVKGCFKVNPAVNGRVFKFRGYLSESRYSSSVCKMDHRNNVFTEEFSVQVQCLFIKAPVSEQENDQCISHQQYYTVAPGPETGDGRREAENRRQETEGDGRGKDKR